MRDGGGSGWMSGVQRRRWFPVAFLAAVVAGFVGVPEVAAQSPAQGGATSAVAVEQGVAEATTTGPVDAVVRFRQTQPAGLGPLEAAGDGGAAHRVAIAQQTNAFARGVPGVVVRRQFRNLGMASVRIENSEQLQAISRLPMVESVGLDRLHTPMIDAHLGLVRQPLAQTAGFTGAGTTVAVIDSGVDYAAPAFGSCAAPGPSCRVRATLEVAPNDGSLDDTRHGTRVSMVVARVAPGASLLAADVMHNGFASTSHIAAAIDWVIDSKLAGVNVTAVNISLGSGTFSAACTDFYGIAELIAAGVTPVAASGNNGSSAGVASPSCVPGTVSVGAVYESVGGSAAWSSCADGFHRADTVPCFSQSGPPLTMVAPGTYVMLEGAPRSGTSFASPFVAGAMAVVTAAHPGASRADIVRSVTEKGPLVTDTRNGRVVRRLDVLLAAYDLFPDLDNDDLPDSVDGCPPVPGPFVHGGCPVMRSDFNADGRDDLGWLSQGRLAAYLGGPGGSLSPGVGSTLDKPLWAGIGDFDGDGSDDLAWFRNGTLTLYERQPNGTWMAAESLASLGIPTWMGTGDFDGNGRDEIALYRDNFINTHALSGGAFVTRTVMFTSSSPVWGGVGDVDGDGLDDILWYERQSWMRIFSGRTGTGYFADAAADALPLPVWAATGDFDNDGRDDLAWLSREGGQSGALVLRSYLSQPSGFVAEGTVPIDGLPRWASIGDYDGNGRDDIAWKSGSSVTTYGFSAARTWSATGTSSLSGTPSWAGPAMAPGQSGVGVPLSKRSHLDLGGDRKEDLAWLGQGVFQYLHGESGLRPEGQASAPPLPHTAVVGDFDGDGRATIAWYENSEGTSGTIFATGWTGSLWERLALLGPGVGNPDWAGAGDFNNDGADDIAWLQAGTLMLRDGRAGLAVAGMTAGFSSPHTAVVGDYDGDGRAEIAWYENNESGGATGTIYRVSWSGTAWVRTVFRGPGVAKPEWADAGDLRGIGSDDLAWRAGGVLSLFDGLNGLTPFAQTAALVQPVTAIIGDYNHDGVAEIAWSVPPANGLPYADLLQVRWAAGWQVTSFGSRTVPEWASRRQHHPLPTPPPTGMVNLAVPVRLTDTRPGFTTVDGLHAAEGVRTAGEVFAVSVAGRGAIHPIAVSAMLNVTVTGAQGPGYLTVFPCGEAVPNASTLNFTTGDTIASSVLARMGTNGRVCFVSSAPVQLIVDATAYFADGLVYQSMPSPARLLDTRPGFGTIDGQFAGVGALPAGATVQLQVSGRPGVPAGERVVSLNVAAVSAQSSGWITAYPCGQPYPTASNLNYEAGQTIANHVVAKTDSSGRVCITVSAGTHMIVDVAGWFVSRVVALPAPARITDTRPGFATIDGQQAGTGMVAANTVRAIQVGGRPGVPSGAAAAVLNFTVTGPESSGWITVFPCGESLPNASNLNYRAGQTIAATALSRLGTGGQVCAFSSANTHLIADVAAYVQP